MLICNLLKFINLSNSKIHELMLYEERTDSAEVLYIRRKKKVFLG